MENILTRRRFTFAASASAVAAMLPSSAWSLEVDGGSGTIVTQKKRPIYAMDLSRSPHAKLRTLPLTAVVVSDGFWGQRIAAGRVGCLPEVEQQEVANGRVLNFQRMRGTDHSALSTDLHSLRAGADSEVYKWIEGASWALTTPDPKLQARVDIIVRDIVGAQEPSGYLDTFFVGSRVTERMLPETQISGHEIYSMGHLLQAGVALYRVTGDRTLLDAGLRFVNDYVLTSFGPEADKKPLMSGHPGPEMMLVELYRETNDPRYLKLAEYLLRGDKRIPVTRQQATYTFAGVPFTGRKVMEGHAVRAVYACCGAADYALETGDPDYVSALRTLWTDMTERQMYVTGAIGATAKDEAFGGDYDLPNEGSYCESCANIGVALWAQRMLALTGEALFADTMERVLYNSVNSGMALDGMAFNYRNPLLYTPANDPKVRRPFWYVNCCPPNLARTFSSLQSAFYSTSKEGLHIHLYDNSELDWRLEDGTGLKMQQSTRFPWDGEVHLKVTPQKPSDFTIFLRIPSWSVASRVTVNDAPVEGIRPGTYLAVRRKWMAGDRVRLTLDMTPRLLTANVRVEADQRRVAVQRGPLVYCMESIDQPQGSLDQIALCGESGAVQFREVFEPKILGGVVTLETSAVISRESVRRREPSLYEPLDRMDVESRRASVRLVPYYTFANRADSAMRVWIPLL